MDSQNPETPFTSLRITDMSDDDRPREKAMKHGIGSLSDAELLAIIFGGGLPGMSVVDMSRKILADCDNRLSLLARLTIDEMCKKYKGVGPAKAISLAAAFELGARCRRDMKNAEAVIRSSKDVYELMRGHMELLDYEEFWILILTRGNTVKYRRCISQGGTSATVVDVKLLLKRAIDCVASAIILIHNHPSGAVRPSADDDHLTKRIKDGAQLLDIRVLDHVIIGRDRFYSYNDEGRL